MRSFFFFESPLHQVMKCFFDESLQVFSRIRFSGSFTSVDCSVGLYLGGVFIHSFRDLSSAVYAPEVGNTKSETMDKTTKNEKYEGKAVITRFDCFQGSGGDLVYNLRVDFEINLVKAVWCTGCMYSCNSWTSDSSSSQIPDL